MLTNTCFLVGGCRGDSLAKCPVLTLTLALKKKMDIFTLAKYQILEFLPSVKLRNGRMDEGESLHPRRSEL